MKLLYSFALLWFAVICPAYPQSYSESILRFQEELNDEYRDPDESPLDKARIKSFKGLPFFPIDEEYRVLAKFEKQENTGVYMMNTSANSMKAYDIYGTVTFVLQGKEYRLRVYQSHMLREKEAYRDYLFLPFTDQTNGNGSYGGGRYIDLRIPTGDTIEIDFNKAYNPYCAYSEGYACPIPPKENDLALEVKAGVKM